MKTILLIEDNKEILENLTEYLEMEGFKILFADSGRKGVELAKEFLPDLIICDVIMPEMNGLEVLQLIVDTEITAKIPFIFSSSMSEKIDREIALKLGAEEYLTKPFELEILLQAVKSCLKSGKNKNSVLLAFG